MCKGNHDGTAVEDILHSVDRPKTVKGGLEGRHDDYVIGYKLCYWVRMILELGEQ